MTRQIAIYNATGWKKKKQKKNGSETWEMSRTARITFPQIFFD